MTALAQLSAQIARILIGDAPDTPSVETRAALDQIATWKATPRPGKWKLGQDVFARRLTALVANPAVIDQIGPYGWCMPAAFLYRMLKDFPRETTTWAVTLFETGSAKLGKLKVAPTPELLTFDFQDYKANGYPQRFPGKTLEGEATDFMLLGSLVQAGSFFKFDGPVDDVGASPGTSRGFVTGLFEETGFAAEIDDQRISTEADVELLIQRSATHRIVLFGAVSSFGDGLLADHAAPLTTAITKKDDGYTFRFWSSGLKDTPPLSERDLRYDSKEILRRKFNGFISVKYK